MNDTPKRVLFVNSEIFPYLPETQMSKIGRYLPQAIQERKHEIRSFMPRFGCVNERKNQLHEVIRLSGMNLIIGDVDRPLIIKVASISSARIQVYFIDNEDYFRRKQTFCDESGKFFEDNDERAIFFARGVLETVKKLRWAPDIIHCQGWISHLLPAYLKKAYRDDPIFAGSRIVLSLCGDEPSEMFNEGFAQKARHGGLTPDDLPDLQAQASGINLAKTAIRYSDGVIMGCENVNGELTKMCGELGIRVLPFDATALESGSYVDDYNDFYGKL